ncbi:MAG: hypothetical protein PHH87_03305 [Desulfuromonas sp.]|nr:hypothetical protein [Desulfuromonas sp.]
MKKQKTIAFLLCLIIVSILSGCAGHKKSLGQFDAKYVNGLYAESTQLALEKQKSLLGKQGSGNLLWTLQAAASSRAASDYEISSELFDQCEAIMKKYDEEGTLKEATNYAAQIAVNDAVLDYRGQVYDGVMVNTYKALNFMSTGQPDYVRIEMNRADDRQRRAVEYFAKEIQSRNEAVEKKKEENEKRGVFLEKALTNPDLQTSITNKYPELEQWETYPDFVNPFTTYMQGLFLFLGGEDLQDLSKARDSFRRVVGMTRNPFVGEDLAVLDSVLAAKISRDALPATVWVVFENGLGPVKDERRIDIPMFFEKIKYVGIALPSLCFRDSAFSTLHVSDGINTLSATRTLASMDRVVQSEFKKEFSGIVTRAVLSTALKSYVQYEAGREYGDLGSLVAGLYQVATTQADVRNWTALPKEFQLARFERPANGILSFRAPEAGTSEILSVNLPNAQFAIVYVKVPSAMAPAVGHVISFGREMFVHVDKGDISN